MPSIRRHPKTNPAEHELEIDRQDMQFIFYHTLQDDETPSTIARLFYPSCTEQGLQLIINGNAGRYPGLEKGRKFKKGTLLVFPAAEIWLVCSQCGHDDDASALCLCDNVCGRAYCTSCWGRRRPHLAMHCGIAHTVLPSRARRRPSGRGPARSRPASAAAANPLRRRTKSGTPHGRTSRPRPTRWATAPPGATASSAAAR